MESEGTKTFIKTSDLPHNPTATLISVSFWQLIGGGRLKDKEYQRIKPGVVKRLTFQEITFNDQCSLDYSPSDLSHLSCNQQLSISGQYSVDETNRILVFTESSGSISKVKLVTLDKSQLILEDMDEFRYHYLAVQE